MSHGPQGEGWEIMWDNCWILLVSRSQTGGRWGYRGRGRRPEASAGTEDGLTSGHKRFLCLGFAGMVEGDLLLEEAGQAGLT